MHEEKYSNNIHLRYEDQRFLPAEGHIKFKISIYRSATGHHGPWLGG